MADTVVVNIRGLSELSEALTQMPKKLAGKALGASVKSGADFVRNRVREAVPVDTGAVKKSIVSYRKKGSMQTNIAYQVGVTMKKKWPRRYRQRGYYKGLFGMKILRNPEGKISDVMWPAFWWIYTEFGTSKKGAQQWFRPTWDMSARPAMTMIKKMLEKAVEIAAAQVPKYRGR